MRSSITSRKNAPRQGYKGAPDAWLELEAALSPALLGIGPGDDVIVITWLHRSRRDVLQVHPGRKPDAPLTGVFATRSPDRPNPVGLHRTTVLEIDGNRLHISPMEAIDGTPVLDIKCVLRRSDDR